MNIEAAVTNEISSTERERSDRFQLTTGGIHVEIGRFAPVLYLTLT